LKHLVAIAAFAFALVVAGSAMAERVSGFVAQIHDGNQKFCVRVGNAWYYVPGRQQQDFRDALVGNLLIAFDSDPSLIVTCHANNGTGGAPAATVASDVDLFPPQQ